ncbi:MAG: head decoration protein [Flavobacteriales bacterium]|nr:head decoration protein [Flavobacteriales bacterium]
MSEYKASFGAAGSTSNPELFAGSAAVTTLPVTFLTGAAIARYAVVGRVAASGKFIISDPAASDGSQVPVGIAVESAASASADAVGNIYISGCFNPAALVWHAGYTTAVLKAKAFDGTSISIKNIG